jgi:hypothetical protein
MSNIDTYEKKKEIQNIRAIELRFDTIHINNQDYILVFNSSKIATVKREALNQKTILKLDALAGLDS